MMEFLPKEPYKRVFVITFYATLACILFYLFFRFFWVPLLPFLLALLLSAVIRPISRFLKTKFRIPIKLSAVLLLLLLVAGVLFLLYFALVRLVSEAGQFLSQEAIEGANAGKMAQAMQEKLAQWFPKAKDYLQSRGFGSAVRSTLRTAASSLVSSIPGILSGFITQLPLAMFFVVVLMIAAYYLTTEREKIFNGLFRVLPDRIVEEVQILRRRTGDCLFGYLKAAMILLFVTFVELFLGFSLLGIRYSLTLAALIAVVDFFPILGTGTVMIPWAIAKVLLSDVKTAIGLLVLWALVSAERQMLEPRVIGTKLGLHPFHALLSMYFGFSLFGFTGLMLAPLALTILIGVAKEKRTKGKEVPKDAKK